MLPLIAFLSESMVINLLTSDCFSSYYRLCDRFRSVFRVFPCPRIASTLEQIVRKSFWSALQRSSLVCSDFCRSVSFCFSSFSDFMDGALPSLCMRSVGCPRPERASKEKISLLDWLDWGLIFLHISQQVFQLIQKRF